MSAPRTFGDLLTMRRALDARCSFCKEYRRDCYVYSTRHRVCSTCIAPRADVVLPRVLRREKHDAALKRYAAAYVERDGDAS